MQPQPVEPAAPAGQTARDGPVMVPCARHPRVGTVLRCGRCETPICPRCLVPTPVGARCPTCAQVKRFAFRVKPAELARAAGLGVAVAIAGSLVLAFIPFLGLFGLAALGYAVGEGVSAGANRKRAPELGPLAVACLVVGYVIGPAVGAVLRGRVDLVSQLPTVLLSGLLGVAFQPLLLVGLGVGALLAWMRVR